MAEDLPERDRSIPASHHPAGDRTLAPFCRSRDTAVRTASPRRGPDPDRRMTDASNLGRGTPPAPSPAPTARSTPDKKKKPTMGPVRQQLEAFGVAILAAVLLKWFCLEA